MTTPGRIPKPEGIGARPSLPLDPILQLLAGQLTLLGRQLFAAPLTVQMAQPNPSRVALYAQCISGLVAWAITPSGVDGTTATFATPVVGPVGFHVRDYPGLVQGAWDVTGAPMAEIVVWEYALQPWWTL